MEDQKDKHQCSPEIEDLLTNYKAFVAQTYNGRQRNATKYWMDYINMMHVYDHFSRSIRIADLDLFIACLPKIANYFFAYNQSNYTRLTVKFHDNLRKLPETHPEEIDQ